MPSQPRSHSLTCPSADPPTCPADHLGMPRFEAEAEAAGPSGWTPRRLAQTTGAAALLKLLPWDPEQHAAEEQRMQQRQSGDEMQQQQQEAAKAGSSSLSADSKLGASGKRTAAAVGSAARRPAPGLPPGRPSNAVLAKGIVRDMEEGDADAALPPPPQLQRTALQLLAVVGVTAAVTLVLRGLYSA